MNHEIPGDSNALLFKRFFANAQYEISGHISLENKAEAVAAATITLKRNDRIVFVTSTNDNGDYQFKKIKQKGAYKLLTEHVSTYPKEVAVNISATVTILDIGLAGYTFYLEPLEVKSLRAAGRASYAGASTSTRNYTRGMDNLGQDIPFALNQMPGVVVNSDAGNGIGYTGMRIRGSDASRINVTINGMPFNDPESQAAYFVDVPDLASSVNDITVQNGVGSSTNGAGAFGANVSISTNRTQTRAYGAVDNSHGSFNTWKNVVKAGTGLISDHFTVDTRLSRISSDGYIDRASSNLKSFYLSGAYIGSKSTLRFNIFSGAEKTYQAWNGVPESMLATHRTYNSAGIEKPGEPYDNETDNYQQTHYQLFFNHRVNDKLAISNGCFLVRGKGYYEQYKGAAAYGDYGLPNPVFANDTLTETDLVRQLWLDNKFYGQIFSVRYKEDKHELTVGGSWSQYDGRHYGNIVWASAGSVPKDYRWYNLKAWKTDVNAYAKWEYEIAHALFRDGDKIFVNADMQYRRVRYEMDGFRNNPLLYVNRDFNFLNPKASITYNHNYFDAFLSYALTNKEPNRDDFEAGEALQPKHETLHDFEAGIKQAYTKISYGATAYYMLYKNQLISTGQINDVGAYTRVNVPNSYRLGVELYGAATFATIMNMNVAANVSFSRNKIKQSEEFIDDYDNGGQLLIKHTNTVISFSPSIVSGLTVRITPVENLDVSFISKYVSRQYLDNTSNVNRSLQPYLVQDVSCSYTLRKEFVKELELIVAAYNIFSRKYEPNGYTYSYLSGGSITTENNYFPMAGINFMAGLKIKL